jgi:hypothetical protein
MNKFEEEVEKRKIRKKLQKANARALRIIRAKHFERFEDVKGSGITLKFHGSGAFRDAYRISGTSLLIKFPTPYGKKGVLTTTDGKRHTRAEVKKIMRLRNFEVLKDHLPPIHYFNSKTGVMVTTFFRHRAAWILMCRFQDIVSEMVKELTGVVLSDICGDNVKINEKGRLVFIDLGY